MIPTLLLVGLVLGMALVRLPRILELSVAAGAAVLLVTLPTPGGDLTGFVASVVLAVINLGLGAVIGLWLVRKIGRSRARQESR